MANRASYIFLLIDDKKDQMSSFSDAGKQRSIRIISVDNVEEGMRKLKADPDQFHAVILDAKCKLKKTDAVEHLTEKPLRIALSEISELERKLDRLIPKCIYTADPIAAENSEGDAEVFRKGPIGTEKTLFDYLIAEVQSNPRNIICKRYQDVLEMFDSGHLPVKGKEDLIQLLLELDDQNPSKVSSNLIRVRRALEMFLTRLSEIDGALLPKSMLQSTSWVSETLKFLAAREHYSDRNPVLPEHLYSILFTAQKATSKAGAHWYNDFVSHYAMRSLAYGMLEALLWFKTFVDENYPDQLTK